LTGPATAGLRDSIVRKKVGATADEGPVRRQVLSEWLPAHAILSRLIFLPEFAFMFYMSQWQGKSQKRHNVDGFDMICAAAERPLSCRPQASVNHMGASMRLVTNRIARATRA
jgi:hypothetical protein